MEMFGSPGVGRSSMRSQFASPPSHHPSPPSMMAGGFLGSPMKTPDRQTSDRYIPDRCSQDHSLSHFYLTSKENATPTSLLRSGEAMKLGGGAVGITGGPTPTSPSAPHHHSISSSEPYTKVLARTLFPSPQTTVLGLHEPNMPNLSEEDRYAKSLAVVYEENRSRHFMSKNFRVIAQTPERILDAPELLDDFYLNLVDWSSTNTLTVALGHTVYLWNADSGSITQLMSSSDRENYVSSVAWHPDGDLLAIGTNGSDVQIWSTVTKSLVQTIRTHSQRVGALSWNGSILAAGSKDTTISLTDVRDGRPFASLTGHAQEVCGVKWSPNGQQLASGGNDNQLNIWDFRLYAMECVPLFSLRQHTAAIKALAWNPMQPNLLASGGGSVDKTIRFWNTATGECLHHIDAKSQVCGLLWSKSGTELISSHGHADNQLSLWKYPSLRKIADLTGHTARVLHLAMSPDGQMVVSASSDETIRFWRCFPSDEEPPHHRNSATLGSTGSGSNFLGAAPGTPSSASRRRSGKLDSPLTLRTPPRLSFGNSVFEDEPLR